MDIRTTLTALVFLTFAPARGLAEPAEERVPVGGFVSAEWRVMGIGGHVSHGPAFAAGATFADGALRLGIGGLARPGPWNPATFDVTLDGDTTYRGQRTLSLRSDGQMLGIHVAAAFELPRGLAITLPVTVGYGGFGFYLHDDDRKTPDGRRVSEWENELFDGHDSHLGVVVDLGVRLALRPVRTPWLRPYVGLYFTVVPGFDTVVRRDYRGFSFALGCELGRGL